MKNTLILIIFGVALSPLISSNKNVLVAEGAKLGVKHNLILGQMNYGDRLLHHEVIHVQRKIFRKVIKEINLPTGYQVARINYIVIIDLKDDGTGGYPSIVFGGLGQRHVTIRLKSQRNHGLLFNVTLYGR